MPTTHPTPDLPLRFHGGLAGTLAPFAVFLAGVIWLGLQGAPDERGFWPMLVAGLAVGLVLAKDRRGYADAVVDGMGRPIVMLMILAWLLAGVLGGLVRASGFVDALVWGAGELGVSGGGFAVAAFLICALVSTATGTSFGTLFVCAPLLYPAGADLGAVPVVLLGAILGGATFGDNISPVSDTTIASAATQNADLGGVVASRLRYALPAAAVAILAYSLLGGADGAASTAELVASPRGLPMLLAPALTLVLLLRKRHLVEGLLAGIAAALVLGLAFGLLEPGEIFYIDAERFGARGLVVEGLEKGVGASIFTLLLMALLGPLEASGVIEKLIEAAERHATTPRAAETWIFAATSAVVMLTTHSTVTILAMGELTRRTGERLGIDTYRRSNLLDVTVCTYPFLLPYCIPTILAASLTAGAENHGMPRLSAFDAGLWNFHSWALLVMILLAIATGYGRQAPEPSGDSA